MDSVQELIGCFDCESNQNESVSSGLSVPFGIDVIFDFINSTERGQEMKIENNDNEYEQEREHTKSLSVEHQTNALNRCYDSYLRGIYAIHSPNIWRGIHGRLSIRIVVDVGLSIPDRVVMEMHNADECGSGVHRHFVELMRRRRLWSEKKSALCFWFDIESEDEMRCYLLKDGNAVRFYGQDLYDRMTGFFEQKYENEINARFQTSDRSKIMANLMTMQIRDIPFERYFNELRENRIRKMFEEFDDDALGPSGTWCWSTADKVVCRAITGIDAEEMALSEIDEKVAEEMECRLRMEMGSGDGGDHGLDGDSLNKRVARIQQATLSLLDLRREPFPFRFSRFSAEYMTIWCCAFMRKHFGERRNSDIESVILFYFVGLL